MRTARKTRGATPGAYVEAVNLAIDYVVERLGEPVRLTEVAKAAHFSPYHFHRVFQAVVGETPADFVQRLRLERALHTMAHTARRSLTEVALACGFSSSSDFSRAFKRRYGVAPSRFDLGAWREAHGAELRAMAGGGAGRARIARLPASRNPDGFKVRLRELPARTVAYIRVRDPYRGGGVVGAVERLVTWAKRQGLEGGQWLGFQWDNPEIVPLEQCQYHVAVEASRFTPGGEIGRFRFPKMLVAEVALRGGIDLELRALEWLYGAWLPRSGYVPDDQPGFEAWDGMPFAHGMEHFEIRAQLPVRRG